MKRSILREKDPYRVGNIFLRPRSDRGGPKEFITMAGTMGRKIQRKNEDILYFNEKHREAIREKPAGKIKVVNPRIITDYPDERKGTIKTARDVLRDYLRSTSVHGLRYFGETDVQVGILGKILWICTMLTCFICLSLMVTQFLRRYHENPTNTYIKTFDAPIYRAPFPAVTICPSTPVSLKRRLAILENVILPENVSREFALNILKYGHLVTNPYTETTFRDTDLFREFLNANKWSVSDFVKTLIPCEDIFESCWWNRVRIDCGKFMRISHSSYGLCCSYNYHLEDYVEAEEGNRRAKSLTSADFGRSSGLKLVVKNEMLVLDEPETRDYARVSNSDGIMVLVHHSMDFPGLNTDMYVAQQSHELGIAINPMLVRKPKGLRHLNTDNRMVPVCIADAENTLDYFPVYRYSNCYANCRVKAMIQVCGCLPFIYDHIAERYNVPRCEADRLHCIQRNAKLIGIVKDMKSSNFTCTCRTPCDTVVYDSFPNAIHLRNIRASKNAADGFAVVNVYMYSQTFQIMETLPAADETYLLASIGGIFSLFLGCSFLSLAEILYFLYLLCRAIRSTGSADQRTKRRSGGAFVNSRRRV